MAPRGAPQDLWTVPLSYPSQCERSRAFSGLRHAKPELEVILKCQTPKAFESWRRVYASPWANAPHAQLQGHHAASIQRMLHACEAAQAGQAWHAQRAGPTLRTGLWTWVSVDCHITLEENRRLPPSIPLTAQRREAFPHTRAHPTVESFLTSYPWPG